MAIPSWLNSYLNASDLNAIEDAVKKAELTTSGELVPIVVRRSSTVGHVPLILLFMFSLLFFVFDIDHLQTDFFDLPHWLLISIDLVVLFLIVRFLAPIAFIERLLTSKRDQAEQVEQRAINEFYAHRVDHTDEATGILLFVSLMEHRAVVLGDESISKKLSPEIWQQVVGRLIKGIKSKNISSGFVDGITMSGKLLEEHFPIREGDVNELKNHLIIKE